MNFLIYIKVMNGLKMYFLDIYFLCCSWTSAAWHRVLCVSCLGIWYLGTVWSIPKLFCDVSNSMSHPLTNLIKLIQHTLLHESRFTATRCSLPFAMSYWYIITNKSMLTNIVWWHEVIIVIQDKMRYFDFITRVSVIVSCAPLGLMAKSAPYIL